MDPEQTFLRVHAKLSGMVLRVLKPRIRAALEYIHLVVALALFCLLVVMHTNFVQQPGCSKKFSGLEIADADLVHIKPGCSKEFSGLEIADADLVHIKINSAGLWARNTDERNMMYAVLDGSSTENLKLPDRDSTGLALLASKIWSNLIGSDAKSKLIFKSWKNEKEFLDPQMENAVDHSSFELVADGAETSVDAEAPQRGFPLSAKESLKVAVIHFRNKCRIAFSSLWRNTNQLLQVFSQIWDGM